MAQPVNGAPVLHVRFEGRSRDIPLGDLETEGYGAYRSLFGDAEGKVQR